MKKSSILAALVVVFVTLPIWYFLLYRILVTINAGELMWFLYWVYVPASLFVGAVAHLDKKT